jgi:hypothetical protein
MFSAARCKRLRKTFHWSRSPFARGRLLIAFSLESLIGLAPESRSPTTGFLKPETKQLTEPGAKFLQVHRAKP